MRRTLELDRRTNTVRITDAPVLTEAQPIRWTFLTPRRPVAMEAGRVQVGPDVQLEYPADSVSAAVEERAIEDARLRGVWGERLYRISLRTKRDSAGSGLALCSSSGEREVGRRGRLLQD
ncbi:MAG: hypothetical protein R2729_30850 [Bryobacteraceae bacterium]